jgi:4,5-dihydroxyphthalate decarboxylase
MKKYKFLTTILLLSTTLSTFTLASQKELSITKPLLSIKVAGYDFKRLEALFDGRVKIKGCDATFQKVGIGDMNTDAFSGPQTYDVTEIGLHPFMLAYANDNFRDYTLLPIFPLRLFRHKSIFISTDSGIKVPKDLIGKTIATPGYSSTSLTWIRGILQDEYGITAQDVKWITSAKDSSADLAGKISKNEKIIPKGITITSGSKGKDESDLLISGEAEALFHAAEPKAYIEGNPRVTRLFPDYRKAEHAYYKKTGIFPIMHAVAIRTSLLKKHPWLAKAVFDAYSESKQLAYNYMTKQGWLNDMLPWYAQELTETRALMGKNFYSYGLEDNRKALETLFRYSHEQGLSNRELRVDDLFDPLGHDLSEEKQKQK